MTASSPVTVVGYDGSSPADRALELAIDRCGGGSLCIVHAWHPPAFLRGSEVYPMVAAASLAEAEDLVGAIPSRHLRLDGITWSSRLVEGSPAGALAATARELGAAEIVVGTHGHGALRSALGSTAHALVHAAPCPVTVVPPVGEGA